MKDFTSWELAKKKKTAKALMEELRDPARREQLRAERRQTHLEEILTDPLYADMTSVLGLERYAPNFPEIVRCFWTTLCVSHGISPGWEGDVYDEALDRLCNIYEREGLPLNRTYIGEILQGVDDPELPPDFPEMPGV